MVPENNSKFLDTVNYSLVKFMQGFVNGNQQYVAIFDRWFGSQGTVALNRDLRDLVVQTMQLVTPIRNFKFAMTLADSLTQLLPHA